MVSWGCQVGDIFIPVSHSEGKYVVTAEEFAEASAAMTEISANTLTSKANLTWTLSTNPDNSSVMPLKGITSKNGRHR